MNILYATDGSDGALAPARLLAALPLGDDCEICLLTVIETDGGDDDAAANALLARAREALGKTRARVRTRVRRGDPAQQTMEQVHHGDDEDETLEGVDGVPDEGTPPDLLVVGTHGRGAVARLFLGSVAERVARHAPCSVLLARPQNEGGSLDRIVVGLDGSDNAARALDWLTRRLPLPPLSEICLVRAITPPAFLGYNDGMLVPAYSETLALALQQEADDARTDLARTANELKSEEAAAGRTIVAEALPGDAASVLLDAAHDHNADLLVVGSHGRSGLERFLLGSVSEKALRHAGCSVLIVR